MRRVDGSIHGMNMHEYACDPTIPTLFTHTWSHKKEGARKRVFTRHKRAYIQTMHAWSLILGRQHTMPNLSKLLSSLSFLFITPLHFIWVHFKSQFSVGSLYSCLIRRSMHVKNIIIIFTAMKSTQHMVSPAYNNTNTIQFPNHIKLHNTLNKIRLFPHIIVTSSSTSYPWSQSVTKPNWCDPRTTARRRTAMPVQPHRATSWTCWSPFMKFGWQKNT